MVLTQKAYAPQSRSADLALFLKVMCQISGAYSLTCHIPKDTVLMTTYPKPFVALFDLADFGTWPHTLLATVDFKSVFRLLPVHPAGRNLLAMQ